MPGIAGLGGSSAIPEREIEERERLEKSEAWLWVRVAKREEEILISHGFRLERT